MGLVKVLKVSSENEILKQIFCSNEDKEYWNDDEYNNLKELFENGLVGFADAGYNTEIGYGDYYILVSDGYSLPVKKSEIDDLKLNIIPNIEFDYSTEVAKLGACSDVSRVNQIKYALLGDEEKCIDIGIKLEKSNELSSKQEKLITNNTIEVTPMELDIITAYRKLPESIRNSNDKKLILEMIGNIL